MSMSTPRPRGRPPAPRLADQWRPRLQRYRSSGQTVATFCATDGVSVAAFYAWQRRLRATTPSTQNPPAFVPVHLRGPSTKAPVELVLLDGLIRRLPDDVDPDWLRRLRHLDGDPPC